MRVTVTQFSDTAPDAEWARFVDYAAVEDPDLAVIGEMPFAPWLAATDQVDAELWRRAVDQHDRRIARFGGLPAGVTVAGSRPILRDGVPYNEGFLWDSAGGYRATHLKYYLPDEPGFWEASWYRRSPEKSFRAAPLHDTTCGFMICTDMWFTDQARGYAAQGVDLLLVPRATEAVTADKWLAGGRAAAVMAGAFCLSANRRGDSAGLQWGGTGWVIDPDGKVLATTTEENPSVTLDIDLSAARQAKLTYPRYVAE